MIDKRQVRRLSKALAHALRHAPQQYHIELDDAGWTSLEDLLAGLRRRRPDLGIVTKADIDLVLAQPGKQRYELKDGRIRALYGHSVPRKIEKQPATPPSVLYHGTSPAAAEAILAEGLRPMRRQYVHLSVDVETAVIVGRRKARAPVVLVIDAAGAAAAGHHFYPSQDEVWLSDPLPPVFISRWEQDDDN